MKVTEFGFSPLPYYLVNYKVRIPKPYKPRNLRDKKRHDMHMRKLLNRKSKMTIKVDYSQSIIDNKEIYDDFIREYGVSPFKR